MNDELLLFRWISKQQICVHHHTTKKSRIISYSFT